MSAITVTATVVYPKGGRISRSQKNKIAQAIVDSFQPTRNTIRKRKVPQSLNKAGYEKKKLTIVLIYGNPGKM